MTGKGEAENSTEPAPGYLTCLHALSGRAGSLSFPQRAELNQGGSEQAQLYFKRALVDQGSTTARTVRKRGEKKGFGIKCECANCRK